MASLQSIFNEFDLDHSGYIDCKQLKQVAKKLGETLSDKQITKLMTGIDTNMDGKISYEEFKEWWTKGHKGKLNDLIILKSKSLKACNHLKDGFCYKGITFEDYKVTEQKDTAIFRFSLGENSHEINPENSGIKFGLLYGTNYPKKFNEESGMKNIFLDESTISLTIKFQSDQPKKLQKAIREVIKQVLDSLALNMGIEIAQSQLEKNDYANIKMQANQKEKYLLIYIEPGNMVKQLIDQMLKPEEQLKAKLEKQFEAKVQFQFSINSGLKEMVQKNKNLVETIMQGCNLNIHASMTSSAAKLIKKFFFKNSRETEAILLTLTRNCELDFKIRTPEKLQEFFNKLGIWQTVSEVPRFKDLIDLITPELQKMKQKSDAGHSDQIPFFTAIHKLLKGLSLYCNSGIEITLQKPNLVVYSVISGEGLKQLHDIVFPK